MRSMVLLVINRVPEIVGAIGIGPLPRLLRFITRPAEVVIRIARRDLVALKGDDRRKADKQFPPVVVSQVRDAVVRPALLARALRDLSARVATGTDRPGVDTWGFRRIASLERDLDLFRPFCG